MLAYGVDVADLCWDLAASSREKGKETLDPIKVTESHWLATGRKFLYVEFFLFGMAYSV